MQQTTGAEDVFSHEREAPWWTVAPAPAAGMEQAGACWPLAAPRVSWLQPIGHLPLAIAACALLVVATQAARAQNALQQFAACMTGPGVAASSACSGFDALGLGSVDLLTTVAVQQPSGAVSSTGTCYPENSKVREYCRLILTPEPVAPATTPEVDGLRAYITIDRKHDFCTPVPSPGSARASASVAGIFLIAMDSTDPFAPVEHPIAKRWIAVGYMAGRNLLAGIPGDEPPNTTGEFTKIWYELVTARQGDGSVIGYYTRRFRDMPDPDYDIEPVAPFECSKAEPQLGEWIVRYPDISGITLAVDTVAGDYGWAGHSATRVVLQGETFNIGDKLPGVPGRHVRFISPTVRFAFAYELGFVALDLYSHLLDDFAYGHNTFVFGCIGYHSGITISGPSEFHIWQGCQP